LEDCLKSARFADDIVVVDSGSTDGTQALAERLGARVIAQDWLGFGPQKQFAVTAARHDWVLCLDADERVSPELQASIKKELKKPVDRSISICALQSLSRTLSEAWRGLPGLEPAPLRPPSGQMVG
jgi:glycosyltransferase involved in cell wall biosynthesis